MLTSKAAVRPAAHASVHSITAVVTDLQTRLAASGELRLTPAAEMTRWTASESLTSGEMSMVTGHGGKSTGIITTLITVAENTARAGGETRPSASIQSGLPSAEMPLKQLDQRLHTSHASGSVLTAFAR